MPYQFPEPLRSQIDAFAGDDAGSVNPELAITRFLIQQAVSDGKAPLANALLATAAKLSSVEIANRVRQAPLERSARLPPGTIDGGRRVSKIGGFAQLRVHF